MASRPSAYSTRSFLVSPIIKNPYFLELFNKEYGKLHGRYIMPFHSSSKLQTFDRERDAGDIDLLIFLNSKALKTQLLENKNKSLTQYPSQIF